MASVSLPNTMLNAAVADSLDVLYADLEKEIDKGTDFKTAVIAILRKHIKDTEAIRFNGNNYSKEWEQEAARRNLPNVKNTAYALDSLVAPKNIEMLLRQKVFSKIELESRYHTKLEQYIKTIEIECETMNNMINSMVIPAAMTYQATLLEVVQGLKNLNTLVPEASYNPEIDLLKKITETIARLKASQNDLMAAVEKADVIEDLSRRAKFIADHILPLMTKVRKPADELENLVADDLWPLPKYSEMLFIL